MLEPGSSGSGRLSSRKPLPSLLCCARSFSLASPPFASCLISGAFSLHLLFDDFYAIDSYTVRQMFRSMSPCMHTLPPDVS